MDPRLPALEALLDLLLRQESALTELVHLAVEEQRALVHSDYEAITAVAERMTAVASRIDELDREREAIASRLGNPLSLEELVPLADSLGVEGLGDVRARLLEQAARLRDAQEQNARLILNAVKLRERWLALLAGMAAPTYGSEGRQHVGQARGIVSRSA